MLEDEMVRRKNRLQAGPVSTGLEMISLGHPLSNQLEHGIQVVKTKWAILEEEAAKKRVTLESATAAFLFFSDYNETDSVIKEFITLAKSKVSNLIIFWFTYFQSSAIFYYILSRILVKTG